MIDCPNRVEQRAAMLGADLLLYEHHEGDAEEEDGDCDECYGLWPGEQQALAKAELSIRQQAFDIFGCGDIERHRQG